MRLYIALLICGLCVMGMAGNTSKPHGEIMEPLAVDPSDGIDKEEAIIVTQTYLKNNGYNQGYESSKPTVKQSKMDDGCWLVSFPTTPEVQKIQGLQWLLVEVDQKNGKVKSVGWGPS